MQPFQIEERGHVAIDDGDDASVSISAGQSVSGSNVAGEDDCVGDDANFTQDVEDGGVAH